MPNIPEAEARMLLSRPLKCEDASTWLPGAHRGTQQLRAGLLDLEGGRTNLFVELVIRRWERSGETSYVFSVFRENRYGMDRVYQLCVVPSKDFKDAHRLPHEHFGTRRWVGSADWYQWEYDEVVRYFCAQTKIIFVPVPPPPESIKRKG